MTVLRRRRDWAEPGFAHGPGQSTSVQAKRAAKDAVRAAALVHLDEAGPIGSEEIRELQRTAGNRATTALLSTGRVGAAVQRSGGGARRPVVQRHLPGVLAKLSQDLVGVRGKMTGYNTADPTNGNLLDYIKQHVTDISAMPGMVTVLDSKEKLIDALATDMAERAEPPTTADKTKESAKDQVINKGGGGFTAKDGTVWMLESTNDSSALYHELIHVLSGEGGVTQLSVTKTMLNEGFTNYFAEELATKYGKAIFPAYPVPTQWVRDFVAKATQSVAYNIYFKNNEAFLYSTLAGRLKTKLQAAKKVFDGDAKAKESNGVKKTDVTMFYKGADIKSDADLAAAVKKKVQEAQFFEATEASLVWLKRLCLDD